MVKPIFNRQTNPPWVMAKIPEFDEAALPFALPVLAKQSKAQLRRAEPRLGDSNCSLAMKDDKIWLYQLYLHI